MDTGGLQNPKLGSDSQDSDDIQQPGPPDVEKPLIKISPIDSKLVVSTFQPQTGPTPKGVDQAKKRLRAFSIQKKSSLSPVSKPKPVGPGIATVFIGKASGVKSLPKPVPEPSQDDPKKPPKPPKPGGANESYINSQKKTLAEIEDMKRKMELVELGIPLGLICPAPDSEYNKAMPTKAMPPIKTFLDKPRKEKAPPLMEHTSQFFEIHREKLDELIREGKKAKAEGKEFKFDYRKLLPDYDNPFQRKKDQPIAVEPETYKEERKNRGKDRRRSGKSYDSKRHSSHKSEDKNRHRDDKFKSKDKDISKPHDRSREKKDKDSKHKDENDKSKERDQKSREGYDRSKEREKETVKKTKASTMKKESEKEAEVNLKDFVVCDSWSDNDEKSKDSTPKLEEAEIVNTPLCPEPDVLNDPIYKLLEDIVNKEKADNPKPKRKRLNPAAMKFKIVKADDDEVLDMFDESTSLNKFAQAKNKKDKEDPMDQLFDFDDAKDETFEGMVDDTFLESVINEIKQQEIDETSQDKGLVEYDESPSKESLENRTSVTPEVDGRTKRLHSSRSDYSEGYKSTESGYKSTDSVKLSDYMSEREIESMVEKRKKEMKRMVEDREIDEYTAEDRGIDKYTAESLETWSFVIKVCQPILFRHDRNKCYKETRVAPKLWYTENPKLCNCVKDRAAVYEELDVIKKNYIDKLYSSEKSPDVVEPTSRSWHPRSQQWPTANVQTASEWEAEDSQTEPPAATPEPSDLLDQEYQRFMATVRPEISDSKTDTPHSSPSRREASKKKASEPLEVKSSKRMKMTSEGWSQESEQEEEVDKSYNAVQHYLYEALQSTPKQIVVKKVKEKRKRKHSTSSSLSDSSESEPKKRKKTPKKKDSKKSKSKESKRRRVSKKNVKKLKEKHKKKKKKTDQVDEDSDMKEFEKEKKKKDKKHKKKKLQKQKKKSQKAKKSKVKSSSSDSSDTEPEKKSKKKKKKDKKKKKKKTEVEEELFDVNILNNIKTERQSDEERIELQFSPRRQKPREIINVKELQKDFVGNSIQIKKEVEDNEKRKAELEKQDSSRELQIEKTKTEKEIQSFKGEEESQSTPQPRPDESNNSQCSSQDSVYSLKDQPAYEKDESHLRPSSQNSNYSFHDVMASKYSKDKQIEQEQVRRFDQDSRSQESDRSRERDSRSQEQESRSRDYDTRSRDHDARSLDNDSGSRKHDPRRQEHELSREESYNYDQQFQALDMIDLHRIPSHIRDIPRPDYDSRSQEHESRSQEHESRSQEHESRSQEHDLRRQEQKLRSRENEISTNDCEMSYKQEMSSSSNDCEMSYKQEMSSPNNNIQSHEHSQSHGDEIDSHEYEGNYEMYEQMAMAYQSDVANQHASPPDEVAWRAIETVVRARGRGEIKCDWRAGDAGAPPPSAANRPSRWGLKPGEVNIVLTGGEPEPVYRIQSLANRTGAGHATGYDEAYIDTYGASDKLRYGDCFSTEGEERRNITPVSSSLDDRINLALQTTDLGDVTKDSKETELKVEPDKGILVTKSLNVENRVPKRVSFADGYKPGQDSDVEEPPVKKKKKSRRLGCAWPCPATHPDHVPLWDALPPPPPPPGSPPPPSPAPGPPTHLLRQGRPLPALLATPPQQRLFPNAVKLEGLEEHQRSFDPSTLAGFMAAETPGVTPFQNM